MGQVKLNVPLVCQRREMSCWYASACMVSYYREAGPRQGIASVWIANNGLQLSEVNKLAKTEGLTYLAAKDHDFSAASLMSTLNRYGPIWVACRWKGYGHVVVITGVSTAGDGEGTVFYNDPEPMNVGSEETVSIKTLNEGRIRGYMLVRPAR